MIFIRFATKHPLVVARISVPVVIGSWVIVCVGTEPDALLSEFEQFLVVHESDTIQELGSWLMIFVKSLILTLCRVVHVWALSRLFADAITRIADWTPPSILIRVG